MPMDDGSIGDVSDMQPNNSRLKRGKKVTRPGNLWKRLNKSHGGDWSRLVNSPKAIWGQRGDGRKINRWSTGVSPLFLLLPAESKGRKNRGHP
jgi:hypothetical protein